MLRTKVTFALVLEPEIFNATQNLALQLFHRFQLVPRTATFTPHISVKQPFGCADLGAMERYFDQLTATLAPIPLTLDGMALYEYEQDGMDLGILWLEVDENPALRQLHNRLNSEMHQLFGDVAAPFDGDAYRFHLTLVAGQPVDVLRPALAAYANTPLKWNFVAREMAMFYITPGWAIVYKTAPLAGKTAAPGPNGIAWAARLPVEA